MRSAWLLGIIIAIIITGCGESKPLNQQHISRASFVRGKEVFMERCMFCHGINADGNGSLVKTLSPPYPSNFCQPEVALIPRDSLLQVIRDGGEATGKNPAMPAWKDVLSNQEIDDLISFIHATSMLGRVPADYDMHNAEVFTK
ncbi:MAG TPA: cytochrome c [Patescibacteria group bacterium]|nr:cytochrome c [Patescibacteria group bacterium]